MIKFVHVYLRSKYSIKEVFIVLSNYFAIEFTYEIETCFLNLMEIEIFNKLSDQNSFCLLVFMGRTNLQLFI